MGLDSPYTAHDIAPQDELAELSRSAAHYTKDMRLLGKSRPYTWPPKWTSAAGPKATMLWTGQKGIRITDSCILRLRWGEAFGVADGAAGR